MEGEGSSARFRGYGFKANGRLGATKIEFVFSFVFETLFEVFFPPPNRFWAPIWVHFKVILKSISCLFLNILLLGKHTFCLDETIVFEVFGGCISVLFRNISQYPFQSHTFLNILHLFGSRGSICGPK